MIEMLGISVPRRDGWFLHRVCGRIPRGKLVAICSADRSERMALLDAIAGRAIPEEGRVWVSGVPLVHGRESRVRGLVAVADLSSPILEGRSALWNALARRPGLGTLGRFLRFPRDRERRGALQALTRVGLEGRSRDFGADFGVLDRARLVVAGCLGSAPEFLVVPEVEATLPPAEAPEFLKLLHGWSRIESLGVIVSGAPTRMLLGAADRVLELNEGLLTFDGPTADLLRRASAKMNPEYPGSAVDFDHPSRGRASDRVSVLGQGVGQRLEKDEV
jgi:ABC-type phosphate/phosphonate transport system ATPase subunit